MGQCKTVTMTFDPVAKLTGIYIDIKIAASYISRGIGKGIGNLEEGAELV